MGFWGGLAKIAGAVLPAVAAPFTGGASLLGYAAKAAPVIAGLAGGRAEGKQADYGNALSREKLDLDRYQLQNQALQDEFKNKLQLNRMQTGRGAYATHPRANVVHFFDKSVMPALPEAPSASAIKMPDQAQMPKSGFLDKVLSIAGPATALAGAFKNTTGGVTGAAPKPGQPPSMIPPYMNPNDPNRWRQY